MQDHIQLIIDSISKLVDELSLKLANDVILDFNDINVTNRNHVAAMQVYKNLILECKKFEKEYSWHLFTDEFDFSKIENQKKELDKRIIEYNKRFVHMLGPQKVALLSVRKCDQMAEYLGNTVSRRYQKFDKFRN